MIRSASQRAKGAGGYMSDFPSGAICVVGLAKVANQNPIHSVHRALAGSFIVDPSSGLVYDVQFDPAIFWRPCSLVSASTRTWRR